MGDWRCLKKEQVAEDRSEWWLQPAGGDDRWFESWHPTMNQLCNRIDELEQKLRLCTILLVSTITICVVLGGLAGSLYYGTDRLTAALTMTLPTSSPSATWRVERAGQSERSEVWAIGEKWIEANALLHFDAHGPQAPTVAPAGAWSGATGAAVPEASVTRDIGDAGSEARAHGCSLVAHERTVTTSLMQHEVKGAGVIDQAEYAVTDFVNLRAAPNSSAEILTVVAQGHLVRRTGHDFGWLQVEYGDHTTNDIKGWVYSGHLRRVDVSGEQPLPTATRAADDPS